MTDTMVWLSVRITGDMLDPQAVTDALGIVPWRAEKNGEVYPVRVQGREYRFQTGLWEIKRPVPDITQLNEHLSRLLDELEVRADALRALTRYDAVLNCFCGLGDAANWEGCISAANLSRIAALGLILELTARCLTCY